MSEYFHVVIRKEEAGNEILLLDSTESEIRNNIVKPFKKGKDLFIEGTIHKTDSIEKVHIVKTEKDYKTELARFSRKQNEVREKVNRKPGPKFMDYVPRKSDIIHCGENVTSEYINEAPSKAKNFFSKILHNPWLVTIGGGILLAFIIWFISKYFGLDL